MTRRRREDSAEAFERRLKERQSEKLVLTLFVAGMSPRSMEAVAAVKDVCEKLATSGYELEVVDLYHHPYRAQREQIVLAPTLVRHAPRPVRRLVGNLTNRDRLARELSLDRSTDG